MVSRTRRLVPALLGALLGASLVLPAGGAFAQTTDQTGVQQQGPGGSPPASYDDRAAPQSSGSMERPKPKGGCLKYGAAGAVGGHFAHHHAVLGAMGGCAVGMYVKHRSKKNIQATGQP